MSLQQSKTILPMSAANGGAAHEQAFPEEMLHEGSGEQERREDAVGRNFEGQSPSQKSLT